ncbi:MAG TPA: secondary thiamine-phosphate synthase enzyme YjbQ [Thermotogota bacterium]|nr:secondary thiamine-phosphate synthase enzyme YjbQ [Thermotogota bacterium]HPJ88095.1 secondary thiamine-phosphate synthase enzyme YjbQ [Thermotogota bacterium]HPR96045.1 secondary thiamine-phosphate synthase enzyme YjbQ [Thermotogota bacterium]
MMKLKEIQLQTKRRTEVIDITTEVSEILRANGIENGLAVIFVPHTTAGITINENADPSVKRDFLTKMNRMIPEIDGYTHLEGNSDAHIKTILTNPSQTVIVEDGRLMLGTWQGVYFCEYDGPRTRKVWVKILEE